MAYIYLGENFLSGRRQLDDDVSTFRRQPNASPGLGEAPKDGQREGQVRAAGAHSRRDVQVEDDIWRYLNS